MDRRVSFLEAAASLIKRAAPEVAAVLHTEARSVAHEGGIKLPVSVKQQCCNQCGLDYDMKGSRAVSAREALQTRKAHHADGSHQRQESRKLATVSRACGRCGSLSFSHTSQGVLKKRAWHEHKVASRERRRRELQAMREVREQEAKVSLKRTMRQQLKKAQESLLLCSSDDIASTGSGSTGSGDKQASGVRSKVSQSVSQQHPGRRSDPGKTGRARQLSAPSLASLHQQERERLGRTNEAEVEVEVIVRRKRPALLSQKPTTCEPAQGEQTTGTKGTTRHEDASLECNFVSNGDNAVAKGELTDDGTSVQPKEKTKTKGKVRASAGSKGRDSSRQPTIPSNAELAASHAKLSSKETTRCRESVARAKKKAKRNKLKALLGIKKKDPKLSRGKEFDLMHFVNSVSK